MSEAADTLKEHLDQIPEPLQSVVRTYIADGRLSKALENLQSKLSLNGEQYSAAETECLMVLCGVTELDDLKDNLIAEAGLKYETALRMRREFEREVLDPIVQEAAALGYNPSSKELPKAEKFSPTNNQPVYEDKYCRITHSVLEIGPTSYPVNKISSVMQPLQMPFEIFGGFLLNGGLLLLGIVGILSFSLIWMIAGLIAAAIGGFNVYGQFNRPWWITVTFDNQEEMRIERPKRDVIDRIYQALRAVIDA